MNVFLHYFPLAINPAAVFLLCSSYMPPIYKQTFAKGQALGESQTESDKQEMLLCLKVAAVLQLS